jgi:beta-glucosidase/6-phospho-beta-glucosidase/beta-galactosidase
MSMHSEAIVKLRTGEQLESSIVVHVEYDAHGKMSGTTRSLNASFRVGCFIASQSRHPNSRQMLQSNFHLATNNIYR